MKKKEPSYPREPAYCHPLLEAVQVGQYSSEAARRRPRLFVACSARSKIIWATVTQGGGLTAFGDGERNAEFVLRGRRTERGRPRPQVPAFTQRHSARMGLAVGSCSALSADGGVRVPRHQPSTNCQRSNNPFQA